LLATWSCADPCNDDGLAQKDCPQDDDAGGEGSGEGTDDGGTGTGTGTDDDGPGTGSDQGGECPDLSVVLTPQVPTIQLVVDQSGSMRDPFGAAASKWEAVHTTLVDPVDGVVTQMQSAIRFGLSRYTTSGQDCPAVWEMAPQLDAADEIETEMGATPDGETPTGESLEIILATLLQDDWEGDKFFVLATDGEPDTCEIPEPTTDQEIETVRTRAVQAVEAAYEAGVRTFVISVGADIATDHLQDMANAGAGNAPGDPDAPFYVALDPQALLDAFDEIVSGLRECTLTLDEPLQPEYAPSCDLTINDELIPYDDPDGWRLDTETTIELQGDACQAIQSGVVVINMTCTCEPGG
jgi:hypothetical protein